MFLSVVTSCVIVDDDLYCVDGQIGCLYKITLTDWKVETICCLDFDWNASRGTDIFFYNNSIWCVPLYARQIAEYQLASKKIKYYHLNNQDGGRLYTVLRNGILYLIPLYPFDDLVEFHIDEKRSKINQNWLKIMRQKNEEHERFLMAAYDGDNLVITKKHTKEVLWINIGTLKIKKYMLKVSENLYGIVWMDGIFYFTAEKNRKVFAWNWKDSTVEEYVAEQQKDSPFLRPVALFDKILLTDGEKQYCLCNGIFSAFQEIEGLEKNDGNASFYYHTYFWDNKIILPPCLANMFLEIDEERHKIKGHILKLPLQDIWAGYKGSSFGEKKSLPLKALLDMVTMKKEKICNNTNESTFYGETLYKKILRG